LETVKKELHTFETKVGGNIRMKQLRDMTTEHEQEVKTLALKWKNVKTIASRNSTRPRRRELRSSTKSKKQAEEDDELPQSLKSMEE